MLSHSLPYLQLNLGLLIFVVTITVLKWRANNAKYNHLKFEQVEVKFKTISANISEAMQICE